MKYLMNCVSPDRRNIVCRDIYSERSTLVYPVDDRWDMTLMGLHDSVDCLLSTLDAYVLADGATGEFTNMGYCCVYCRPMIDKKKMPMFAVANANYFGLSVTDDTTLMEREACTRNTTSLITLKRCAKIPSNPPTFTRSENGVRRLAHSLPV